MYYSAFAWMFPCRRIQSPFVLDICTYNFYPLISLWALSNQKEHDRNLQVHENNRRDIQLNVSIIRNTSMLYNMHLFCHLFRWRSSTPLITILASSLDDIVNSQQYPGSLNRGFQRLDLS